jgi:hypothetical protein
MEYQITNFKGMTTDTRRGAELSSGFNITKRDILEMTGGFADQTAASVIHKVITATPNSSARKYYALQTSGSNIAVYTKDTLSANWTSTFSNSVGSNGTGAKEMLAYFQPTNSLYYYDGAGAIRVFSLTAFTGANTSITSSSYRTDAFINPNDGKMYFGTGSELCRVDLAGTIATDIAPSIPSDHMIKSIGQYGVYLLVACYSLSTRKSVVYLVDVDIDTPAPVSVIDAGDGEVSVCDSLRGAIFSVSVIGLEMVVRVWTGGDEMRELYRKSTLSGSSAIPNNKYTDIDKLYFSADFTDTRGVWSIGFNQDGQIKIGNEYFFSRLTGTTVHEVRQFSYLPSEAVYIDDSQNKLNLNTLSTVSGGTSSYITEKVSSNRIGRKLHLKNIALRYSAITNGRTISLSYRVDGGSWNTIVEDNTAGSVISTVEEYQANGDRFDSGYEYQFKIDVSGGSSGEQDINALYANFEEDNE